MQVRDSELSISFLHHQAVQRRVRNPFESSGAAAGRAQVLGRLAKGAGKAGQGCQGARAWAAGQECRQAGCNLP